MDDNRVEVPSDDVDDARSNIPQDDSGAALEPLAEKRFRERLLSFILVQVLAGLLLSALAEHNRSHHPGLASVALIGTVFGQVSLLGIWGGLGCGPWYLRLVGVACGVGFLALLTGIAFRDLTEWFIVVFLSCSLIAAMHLVLRCFGFRFAFRSTTQAARLQYSIRDLLILTFVVALMLSVGRYLLPTVPLKILSMLFLVGISVTVVGVASVWLVLGMKRRIVPSTFLVLVGAGVGTCLELHVTFMGSALLWPRVFAVDALMIAVSLNILRSWGYRLVRHRTIGPSDVVSGR